MQIYGYNFLGKPNTPYISKRREYAVLQVELSIVKLQGPT